MRKRRKNNSRQERYKKRLREQGRCILCGAIREEDRPGHTYYKSYCRFHGALRRLYDQRRLKHSGWDRNKPGGRAPFDVPVKDRYQLERLLGRKNSLETQ